MRILSHGVDRVLNIQVYTDDDVELQNRVTLSGTMPPDEHGRIPRVEVHRRARSRRTRANREFLTREAVRLLKAAGATEVYRIDMPPFIAHIHSTMRMGERETDSVLDSNAESRAVKWLFVGDNSALANGVGGVNPTLTTQALADPHGREDLPALLRRISMGAHGVAGGLDRALGHRGGG